MKQHDQFLEKRNNLEAEYSYDSQSTWHSDFDPKTCLREIPEAELPPKPSKGCTDGENSSNFHTMKSFLSRNATSQAVEAEIFGKDLFEKLQSSVSKKFGSSKLNFSPGGVGAQAGSFGRTEFGVPQPRSVSEFTSIKESSHPVIRGVDFSNYKERYLRSNNAILEHPKDNHSDCGTVDPTQDLENKII